MNANCMAFESDESRKSNLVVWSPLDAVLQKHVGPQNVALILKADSVRARVLPWEEGELHARTLCHWMQRYVQYTLCLPSMYQSNRIVYSAFTADAFLTFLAAEKKVTIELDFSILKWRLINEKGEEVCRHDLIQQDFLPMLYMLFPESRLLSVKYDKYLEKYEK